MARMVSFIGLCPLRPGAARARPGVMLVLVAVLVPALQTSADTTVSSLPTDAVIHDMLVRRIEVQHRGTGAVVLVVTPEGRRTISHGTVAAGSARPVNGDTVFGIASITKLFTAVLLAEMVRRGELGLDDPAARHLGAHAGSMPSRDDRPVTLADLATHTSGLPLRPSNLVSQDPDNKYDGYTPEMLYAFLASYELPRAPGTGYEYSNVGYGLLGQVLAARSGKSYERLVSATIIEPLGMTSTGLDSTPDMQRRSATGYTVEGRAVRDAERGALDAAGALHSTANDLAKLLEAALGLRRSLLGPAMQATLATRRPGGMAPWSTQIALAWNVLKVGDREVVWKNGSANGFRSFVGFDPAARVGVIGLINVQSDLGVDDIGMHLLGANVPVDLHVPRPHVQVAIDPALLDRYAGRYYFSADDIATFVREGDRFFYVPAPGQKLELFAEGERDFFFKEADAQVTFEVDATGPATAAIWHQWGQVQRGERLP